MERISRFRQFLGTPCKYTLRPKQRLLSKSYEACIRVSLPTSCHLALESVSLATSIFVFASISVMSLICLNFPDAISLLFLSQFSVFLGFFSSHSEDHHGFRKLRGPRRYCHRTIVQYFYWESHSCTPAINVYRPLFYCSHCSTVRLLDKARRCYRYYCSLVLPAHCYTNRHHREDARPIVKWRFISVQCCKSCCAACIAVVLAAIDVSGHGRKGSKTTCHSPEIVSWSCTGPDQVGTGLIISSSGFISGICARILMLANIYFPTTS